MRRKFVVIRRTRPGGCARQSTSLVARSATSVSLPFTRVAIARCDGAGVVIRPRDRNGPYELPLSRMGNETMTTESSETGTITLPRTNVYCGTWQLCVRSGYSSTTLSWFQRQKTIMMTVFCRDYLVDLAKYVGQLTCESQLIVMSPPSAKIQSEEN